MGLQVESTQKVTGGEMGVAPSAAGPVNLSAAGLFGLEGRREAEQAGREFETKLRAAENRLSSWGVDNYRGTEAERAVLSALLGESVTKVDGFRCYTDFSTPGETAVIVYDPSGRSRHKYVFAETDSHRYIVAMPISWTEYHREIVQRVSCAAGERAHCPGGGYIAIADDGRVIVDGSSGDFGRGNHAHAKAAFERATKVQYAAPPAAAQKSEPAPKTLPVPAVTATAPTVQSPWTRFVAWLGKAGA